MATVTYQNATRIYPGSQKPAVDSLNLEIGDGEFLVLVGPSGCGKSTSLRMLAGLEDVDSGSIFIDQRDVTNLPPKSRDIAMVFQNYALYPHMTVYENMAFALKLRKTPKSEIDAAVKNAAKLLQLEEYLNRKPKALSGGQRQRVAMGRAIVRKPQVFLMDEPLSNLDAKLRVQTRSQIATLQAQLGTTTVYVTHDQTEAMTLGDRVAVMRTGVLQQVGSPQELYERPKNLFVAGFIGSPAMNFLAGTLEEGRLRTGLGDIPLSGRLREALSTTAAGRTVIVGIRPEDFGDLALVPSESRPSGITFPASIDVVESLGSEKYVYFSKEIGNVETAELAELARDSGRADSGATSETVVARLDPATRIGEGQTAELWADVRALHVFDPTTGINLTLGDGGSLATAAASPAGGAAPAQAGDGASGQDSGSAAAPPR